MVTTIFTVNYYYCTMSMEKGATFVFVVLYIPVQILSLNLQALFLNHMRVQWCINCSQYLQCVDTLPCESQIH